MKRVHPSLKKRIGRGAFWVSGLSHLATWDPHPFTLEIDGREYLLELPLRADFALIESFLADYLGNVTYVLTARNFNPVIAMAAQTVIVHAEHVVPVGMISPDHVGTPAVLVDYLVASS